LIKWSPSSVRRNSALKLVLVVLVYPVGWKGGTSQEVIVVPN
jgi:hypothetical protein